MDEEDVFVDVVVVIFDIIVVIVKDVVAKVLEIDFETCAEEEFKPNYRTNKNLKVTT